MRLGYDFKNPALLEQALTHGSYANEHPGTPDNERLEFLGDAVVELITTELLYQQYPAWPEGPLSQARSLLVKEPTLASLAQKVGVGATIRLGIGEDSSKGRTRPKVLADAMEAMVGAAFLDGGLAAAKKLFVPLILPEIQKLGDGPAVEARLVDARSGLQALAQKLRWENPKYVILAESGPPHSRRFTAEVEVNGIHYGPVEGVSKKEAWHRAAVLALEALHNGS